MNNNLRNLVQPVQELSSQPQASLSDTFPAVDPNSQTQSYHDSVVNSLSGKYSQLARLNPWMKYDYTPTLWDNIGNFIGFDTQEDAIRREMQTSAKQYDSQLLEQQFQNEYNSEQAKAERMRVAGMNPDLQGTSGVSDSSDFDDSQPRPSIGQTEFSSPMDFANIMLNVFGSTLNALNTFNGIRKTAADLETQDAARAGIDLDNLGKIKDLASFIVPSIIGTGKFAPSGLYFTNGRAMYQPKGTASYNGFSGSLSPAALIASGIPFFPRYGSANDMIFNMMTHNVKQLSSTYGDLAAWGKNKEEAISHFLKDDKGVIHNPYRMDSSLADFDETFADVFGDVAAGTARVVKKQLESKRRYFHMFNANNGPEDSALVDSGQAKFNADYFNALNQGENGESAGNVYGRSHVFKFISARDRAEMEKELNHIYQQAVSKLARKAENGKVGASIALLGLSTILNTDTVAPSLGSAASTFNSLLNPVANLKNAFNPLKPR